MFVATFDVFTHSFVIFLRFIVYRAAESYLWRFIQFWYNWIMRHFSCLVLSRASYSIALQVDRNRASAQTWTLQLSLQTGVRIQDPWEDWRMWLYLYSTNFVLQSDRAKCFLWEWNSSHKFIRILKEWTPEWVLRCFRRVFRYTPAFLPKSYWTDRIYTSAVAKSNVK